MTALMLIFIWHGVHPTMDHIQYSEMRSCEMAKAGIERAIQRSVGILGAVKVKCILSIPDEHE